MIIGGNIPHGGPLALSLLLIFAAVFIYLDLLGRDELTGTAAVVDGDTIDVQRLRIRLYGIDAPESDQRCRRYGVAWPCDRKAAFALLAGIPQNTGPKSRE